MNEGNSVVSAGADGWIRYWDTQSIAEADIDTDMSVDCMLEPTCELQLARLDEQCSIGWMLAGTTSNSPHYYIRDLYGKLWDLPTASGELNKVSATCVSRPRQRLGHR